MKEAQQQICNEHSRVNYMVAAANTRGKHFMALMSLSLFVPCSGIKKDHA